MFLLKAASSWKFYNVLFLKPFLAKLSTQFFQPMIFIKFLFWINLQSFRPPGNSDRRFSGGSHKTAVLGLSAADTDTDQNVIIIFCFF